MTFNIDMAMEYSRFVINRHAVWQARQNGAVQSLWTLDPILAARKFTNVFRVLDPGSQFLLTDLFADDPSPRDTLARCFLYRYTNLPDTWRWAQVALGRYPEEQDLNQYLVDIIQQRRDQGHKIFSGAYMIVPQPNRSGDKVAQAVQLARDFMDRHAEDFLQATRQEDRFIVLRRLYGVGDFMAMQILTDWGYSRYADDRENEFIVPGPGCVNGTKHVDLSQTPTEMIYWGHDVLLSDRWCPEVQGRKPSWMDVQNTFCEFSKYVRFMHRPEKATPYTPAHPGPQPEPVLPHWWTT